jgi:hypothetical protein
MTNYSNELEEVLHHAEEVEKEADELIEQVKRAEDRLKQAEDHPIEQILGDQGHIPDRKYPA